MDQRPRGERTDQAADRPDQANPGPVNRNPPLVLRRRQERREAARVRVDGARVPATREPIYARLVAEWRAQGRTVPAEPDVPRGAAGRAVRPGAERR
ncbi:hypothetical protein [Streptomyces sp. AF1A]|uniref:hypothetical protein n=1 Tax=Streptomyces sp. AF1A TaxID=3394350 RepID=UPI0039BC3162